jgi:hypothetical protein
MGDASLDEQGKPQGVALDQASALRRRSGLALAKLPEDDAHSRSSTSSLETTDVGAIGGGHKRSCRSAAGVRHALPHAHLKGMYAWLQFALEVHYGPLFSGLVDTLGGGPRRLPPAHRRPRASRPRIVVGLSTAIATSNRYTGFAPRRSSASGLSPT